LFRSTSKPNVKKSLWLREISVCGATLASRCARTDRPANDCPQFPELTSRLPGVVRRPIALFASKTDRIHQDVDLTTEPHERRGGCDVGTASTPESYLASAKLRDRRWVGPKPKSTDTLKLLIGDFLSAFLDLFDGCGSRLHLRCVLLLFIVGGIFSFLPILGAWMLPLGLLLIAQDVTALQKPIVTALMWTEARWKSLKAKWHAARCRKAG
jgi:hypothetical protein